MATNEATISELTPATAAHPDDRLETSQIEGAGWVSKSVTLDQVTDLVADSDQITSVIDSAIGAIPPPPPNDWDSIPGKPATFPPTIPSTPGTIDDWPYLPLTGGTLTGALSGTTATMSGTVTAGHAAIGRTVVSGGGATQAGYIEFRKADNTRLGYLGLGTDRLAYTSEVPAGHEFSGNVNLLNALIGTSAAFSSYATINGTLAVGAGGVGAAKFRSNGADADLLGLFSGTTKGLRITTSSTGASIEGVDNTGTGSFQPLSLSGSLVNITAPLTGTTATFNQPSGTSALHLTAPDGSIIMLANGASKGVRIGVSSTATSIEGVDNTGTGSFQPLVLNGLSVSAPTPAPTANDAQIATTAWVKANAGAATSTSATAPSSPTDGQMWWNSDASVGGGQLYIRYNDGTGASQWVPASPGVGSGAVVQTVFFETGAMATGTTAIPSDDTIPQITEGDQYMTLAITPRSATSKLIIDVVVHLGHTVAPNAMTAALFQDATANALAASAFFLGHSGVPSNVSFRHVMTSGTTSATTFRVRAGGNSAGTATFNGFGSGRIYGGVMASSIVIQEVL